MAKDSQCCLSVAQDGFVKALSNLSVRRCKHARLGGEGATEGGDPLDFPVCERRQVVCLTWILVRS